MHRRAVVVGGGILGTLHALEARRHGFEVVHLERDAQPRGASGVPLPPAVPGEEGRTAGGSRPADRGERFVRGMARLVAVLPLGLDGLVAPTLLGFALINGLTFAVDLALLTLLRGALHLTLAPALTLSYLAAFSLGFALNRSLNFRSHAPVGRQLVLYLAAIGVNYLAFVAGAANGLAAAGLEYHEARVLAAACEGVYMYGVLRWVVFRSGPRPGGG